jgi:hypothetical protein
MQGSLRLKQRDVFRMRFVPFAGVDAASQAEAEAGTLTTKFMSPLRTKQAAQFGTFTPNGSGAVNSTIAEKLGESVSVMDFGAVGDGTADDTAAFAAAIAWASSGSNANEGMERMVFAPAGYRYRITSALVINVPIGLHVFGFLEVTMSSGSAIIVGQTNPAGRNKGWDIYIAGMRQMNGNGSMPSSINASGVSAIEICGMQFSRLRIDQITAFTKYGFWGNSSNNRYTGQQIQDNHIWLGEVAFCGAGIYCESVSAETGSFQVNTVFVQNSFSNFKNCVLGPTGDVNTNNNKVYFDALDNANASGTEFECAGSYNYIIMPFTEGRLAFLTGSAFNSLTFWQADNSPLPNDAGFENTIIRNGSFFTPNTGSASSALRVTSRDAGASDGPYADIRRQSASPAANDALGGLRFWGRTSTAADKVYGTIRLDAPTVTNGNENGRLILETIVGGTTAVRGVFWQGLTVGNVSDQGLGTLNTQGAIYANSNLVIDTSGNLRPRRYTAAQIADITHPVNTTNKEQGIFVYDTTNNRMMCSTGAAAGSAWTAFTPGTSVNPV